MQQHELAEKDYILGMKYKDIAEKYNVSVDTVKKWKTRYKWERDKPIKSTQKPVHNVHKNKKVDKKSGQEDNTKPESEPDPELTDKEQLFCYHYVRTWNATQAALKSGYSQNKVSAQVLGSRLLQRPRVKQEIDRLRELFRQEIHIDIQDFLAYCMKVVAADIGDYLTFGQKLITVEQNDEGEDVKAPINFVDLGESNLLDTSVIQEVKQGKDGISIKLADKKWAWEQLVKYFDWLPDQWKRKVEIEKLDLERQRLAILKSKAGDNDDEEVDSTNFVEALSGKVSEVWADEK